MNNTARWRDKIRLTAPIGWATAVLLFGLLLTMAWTSNRHSELQKQAEALFQLQADILAAEIERRVLLPQYGLRGGAGAIAFAGSIDRLAFRRYVQSRNLDTEFPGVQGFGFIERVARTDLQSFVQRERLDAAPDFSVRSSGVAEDLFVIKYIEPLKKNLPAWGFDIGSDPVRRAAAEAAMRSGKPQLSKSIILLQDERQTPGWLLLVPSYRAGADLSTPLAREAAFKGLVYAPIVAAEVLAGALSLAQGKLAFELFEGETGVERLIFDSDNHPASQLSLPLPQQSRLFKKDRKVQLAGQDLTLRISSLPALEAGIAASTRLIYAVLAAGILLWTLLACAAWFLATGRERALATALGLAEDRDRLAKVVSRSSNAVFGMDEQGRITWVNEGFTRIYGYSAKEAMGRTAHDLVAHPNADPRAGLAIARAKAERSSCRVEILNRHKDGHDFWVETDLQPALDQTGNFTGFIEVALDVTARKMAEADLASSEAFLAQAQQIAGVGGWELDLESDNLRITPQLREIFGIPAEGVLTALDFVELFAPEVRASIERLTADCIRTGQPWDVVLPVADRGGRRRWVRTFGRVEQEGNRSMRLVGAVHDVTDRQELEEELRMNNARLQAVIENLPCGLSVIGGDLKLVAHNTMFRSLLAFPDELFTGRDVQFEDIIRFNAARGEYGTGDTEAAVQQIIERARKPTVHKFERIRPDGVQLEVRGAPMPGGGFVTTYVDITDRKLAEQAMQASETLIKVVADNIPGRVAYWDQNLSCKFANKGYCETFGTTREESIGRTIVEIQGDERYKSLAGNIARVLAGEPVQFEQQETDALGREKTSLTRYLPDVEGDHVRGFFVLAMDVTELREARDVALQASRTKSQFVANMSHEIRTPMNAILGMLTLLQSSELDVKQQDYVDKTEGAARSLLGLLNDILDFSKIEAGKMTLDLQPFSLDALLRDLAVIFSANIGNKNLEVLFDIDASVPPWLMGDDMRLRQILINLGGNAIKFTERGEVVVRFKALRVEPHQAEIEISVSDTGIGIAPENQATIFTGFSQAEASTTRRFGGTGLGLAICRQLIGLMGGVLDVESGAGKGSRFYFRVTLPIASPAEAPPLVQTPTIKRILIIDDNPVAREVMSAMADSLGWTADVAASGEEALTLITRQAAQARHHDVIFIDWRMPGLDGWETTQRIRAHPAAGQAPLVVMVSSKGRDALALRDKNEQALLDGFLVKPVTASMLLDALNTARRPADARRRTPSRGAPTESPLAGIRLLVVEDNDINQQIAVELLMACGATVDVADNGREGVARVLAARPPYDVVLMDIQMPVMDGYEATRELRQTHGLMDLPVIAMTANAMASDRADCLAAGMNEHVGKPFDLKVLVALLLRFAGSKVD